MTERNIPLETLNSDSKEFLEEFTKRNITKYRDLWIKLQGRINELGPNAEFLEFGYPFGQIYKHKDKEKTLGQELEFRGFTLKKFPQATEAMLAYQKPIPLPAFLLDDLSDWTDVLSTKGTILSADGKITRFENRNIEKEKSGGVIRIFPGYQIGLFIKYGTKENPSTEPVDYKLVPAGNLKKAVTYEGLYLG